MAKYYRVCWYDEVSRMNLCEERLVHGYSAALKLRSTWIRVNNLNPSQVVIKLV